VRTYVLKGGVGGSTLLPEPDPQKNEE
jgi:hypothetical protein